VTFSQKAGAQFTLTFYEFDEAGACVAQQQV
jgi:hypothetical protein